MWACDDLQEDSWPYRHMNMTVPSRKGTAVTWLSEKHYCYWAENASMETKSYRPL